MQIYSNEYKPIDIYNAHNFMSIEFGHKLTLSLMFTCNRNNYQATVNSEYQSNFLYLFYKDYTANKASSLGMLDGTKTATAKQSINMSLNSVTKPVIENIK